MLLKWIQAAERRLISFPMTYIDLPTQYVVRLLQKGIKWIWTLPRVLLTILQSNDPFWIDHFINLNLERFANN